MAPASPSIGEAVTEGYSRGIDRLGEWLPSLMVVAVVAGALSGGVAQLQEALAPGAREAMVDMFSGRAVGRADTGEIRTYQLLGAVGTVLSMFISYGALAVFGGALHAARHGGSHAVPGPAAILPAVLQRVAAMMPRIATVAGLMLGGLAAPSLLGALGALIGLACWVTLIVVLVRWIYATIIVGSGEATGAAAFDRSASVVRGAWWRTLGFLIVVSLAIGLPIVIIGAIAGSFLPGPFLGSFATTVVVTLLSTPILASALETAWARVEGHAGTGEPDATHPDALPPTSPPPTSDGPFS